MSVVIGPLPQIARKSLRKFHCESITWGERLKSLPANPYETPPGYYMVFIINDHGTPSKAKMIRINPADDLAVDPA